MRVCTAPFHGSTTTVSPVVVGDSGSLSFILLSAALLFRFQAPMSAAAKPPIGEFTSFPGERPAAHEAKRWLEIAQDQLTTEQRAVLNGVEPTALLALQAERVPTAFVVGGDVTAAMAANRDALRTAIEDRNTVKAATYEMKKAEILNSLHTALRAACIHTAPLLVKKMEAANPLSQAGFFDGVAFWKHIETMQGTSEMLPNEDCDHDRVIRSMEDKPLRDGASAQEFSEVINTAVDKHIPFLIKRPFATQRAISEWILERVPAGNAVEARLPLLARVPRMTHTR